MDELLLVGGGRWARVYLSVLAQLDCRQGVVVASRHGGDRLTAALDRASRPDKTFRQVRHWRDAGPVAGAIVANTARAHAATTLDLLDSSIPVLVEKPAAMTMREAECMVTRARGQNCLLMPALVMRHCQYLSNFARMAAKAIGVPTAMDVHWRDASAEFRYGEVKESDFSVSLAENIGPHIASLSMVLAGWPEVNNVEISRGGLCVLIKGRCNGAELRVTLEHDAPARQRLVVLTDGANRKARLDFTIEPGTIEISGARQTADADWSMRPSPLTLQLQAFLRQADDPPQESELAAILASTSFSIHAAELARTAQRAWLAENPAAPRVEQLVAMRELLAPHLVAAHGLRAGDNFALAAAAERALSGDSDMAPFLRAAGL